MSILINLHTNEFVSNDDFTVIGLFALLCDVVIGSLNEFNNGRVLVACI